MRGHGDIWLVIGLVAVFALTFFLWSATDPDPTIMSKPPKDRTPGENLHVFINKVFKWPVGIFTVLCLIAFVISGLQSCLFGG